MKSINKLNSVSRWLLVAGLMLPLAAQATTITGTVTNKTTGRPDTTDPVVLMVLSQGMEKVATIKPDAKGHFSFTVTGNDMHLLRVDHQKAPYFTLVQPGTTHADVTVYDVALNVPGVTTEVDVLSMETGSQGLEVNENYFVNNASNPPKTQYGPQAYPIYIPANAQIEGAQAEGPQGMPVSVSPVPLAFKGHYAFMFPVRPGQTRFGISYLIPYSGSFTFHPQVALPTTNLAVMLPNSMTFNSPGASGFEQVQDSKVPAQTFVSKNVKPGVRLAFTVSGTGTMPTGPQAQSGSQGQAASGPALPNDRPGGGLGPPIDAPGPLHKYRWWIVSALGLLLVIVAGFLLSGNKNGAGDVAVEPEENPMTPTAAFSATLSGAGTGAGGGPAAGPAVTPPDTVSSSETSTANAAARPEASTVLSTANNHSGEIGSLLNGLKDELFALETDRAEGKLTEEQYIEAKNAMGIVLRRALSRRG